MKNVDEPLFDDGDAKSAENGSAPPLEDQIRYLVSEQPYAVLCVQGQGQPYGALVAFAFTDDLKQAVFATPVTTRKFRLLSECSHVALVIDNRPSFPEELMDIEALTVTGRSLQLERSGDFDIWAELLLAKHPYLKSFINAESCALFRVDVVRYFHVVRFQEVHQWIPSDHS